MQEARVRFLSREGLLEKEMAIHSNIIAWEIRAWWATVHGVTKESEVTEWLTLHLPPRTFLTFLDLVLGFKSQLKCSLLCNTLFSLLSCSSSHPISTMLFSGSVVSDSLWLLGLQQCQAFPSYTISQNLFKLISIESVMPSNHFVLCCPLFFLPLIFPSIRVFPNESVLHIREPQYWSFSFSISPSNQYSWLLSLGWLLWSPCSPRDSQETSLTPQFKSINSLALSILYGPTLTSTRDYWKNHSFN